MTTEPASLKAAAHADMRIEIVKREINQGALAGFDSAITDHAARLVIAALDSYDEHALKEAYRVGYYEGFEAGARHGARPAAAPARLSADTTEAAE